MSISRFIISIDAGKLQDNFDQRSEEEEQEEGQRASQRQKSTKKLAYTNQ